MQHKKIHLHEIDQCLFLLKIDFFCSTHCHSFSQLTDSKSEFKNTLLEYVCDCVYVYIDERRLTHTTQPKWQQHRGDTRSIYICTNAASCVFFTLTIFVYIESFDGLCFYALYFFVSFQSIPFRHVLMRFNQDDFSMHCVCGVYLCFLLFVVTSLQRRVNNFQSV